MDASFLTWAAMLAGAGLMAFLALLGLGLLPDPQARTAAGTSADDGDTVFLFHGEALVDHDAAADGPAAAALDGIADWAGLRRWLQPRFDNLPERLSDPGCDRPLTVDSHAPGPPGRLTIAPLAGAIRVTLSDGAVWDAAARHAAAARLHDCESAVQNAPNPVWKTAADGQVIWRNGAAEKLGEALVADPAPAMSDGPGETATARVTVGAGEPGTPRHYEVCTTADGEARIHHALDISQVVRAESVRREFVQTLTKTFATLTTGLAIFDRDQRLALFNPALIDLTDLPAEFLSGRPQLMAFFDALRDRQVLPEPKDYSDWRSQIARMIEQAAGGLYQDTWSLPGGITYRVTGRPHPDGAVAFLFEDISAETALTRRFRAQIDVGQAVLDRLDDALAIIGPNKTVLSCNAAFARLIGHDPDTRLTELRLTELIGLCRKALPDPDAWAQVEQALLSKSPDPAGSTRIAAPGRRNCACTVTALTGGNRLLRLALTDPAPAPAPAPALT